jgi:hypothetical protein
MLKIAFAGIGTFFAMSSLPAAPSNSVAIAADDDLDDARRVAPGDRLRHLLREGGLARIRESRRCRGRLSRGSRGRDRGDSDCNRDREQLHAPHFTMAAITRFSNSGRISRIPSVVRVRGSPFCQKADPSWLCSRRAQCDRST